MRTRRVLFLLASLLAAAGLLLGAEQALAALPPALTKDVAGGGGRSSYTTSGVSVQDTFGQPVVGTDTTGSVTLTHGFWSASDRLAEQCGVTGGSTYVLGESVPFTITVVVPGDMECLRVVRQDARHPYATGAIGGNGVGQLRYFQIWASEMGGGPASGFTVSLTMAHNNLANPLICRSQGPDWDCARSAKTTTTVTRTDVTQFSEWALGENASPTAIAWQRLSARLPGPNRGLSLLSALLLAAALVLLLVARRRAS